MVKITDEAEYAEMYRRFTKQLAPGELDEIKDEIDLVTRLTQWMKGHVPSGAQVDAFEEGGARELMHQNREREVPEPAKAPGKFKGVKAAVHRARQADIRAMPYSQRVKYYSHVKTYKRAGRPVKGYWRVKKLKKP